MSRYQFLLSASESQNNNMLSFHAPEFSSGESPVVASCSTQNLVMKDSSGHFLVPAAPVLSLYYDKPTRSTASNVCTSAFFRAFKSSAVVQGVDSSQHTCLVFSSQTSEPHKIRI